MLVFGSFLKMFQIWCTKKKGNDDRVRKKPRDPMVYMVVYGCMDEG